MNPHFWNPAGRLWALLVHCRTREFEHATVHAMWADYLGLPPGYSPGLLAALAPICRLPQQVRERIAAGDVPSDAVPALLDAVDEAESALSVVFHLDSPIQVLRDRYRPETLAALKEASVWLNASVLAGRTPGRVRLDDVRHHAQRLSDEVAAEISVGPDIGDFVFVHASAVLSAAGRVSVAGPEALVAELHRLIGHLALRPDVVVSLQGAGPLFETTRELIEALRSLETADPAGDGDSDWERFSLLLSPGRA